MAKLRFSLILAFLLTAFVLVAPVSSAQAEEPWPEGWRVMRSATPSFDIRFVDPLNGWGSYDGGVLRTTDGGQTWTELPSLRSNLDWRYEEWVFVTPLVGWAGRWTSCPAGWAIDMTTDGGMTWTEQVRSEPNYYCGAGSVSFLHFIDTQYGWATVSANNPTSIKTTDGGKTWTQTNRGGGEFDKIVSRSFRYWLDIDGQICDEDWCRPIWRIYKTTDGGETAGGLLPWWTASPPARIPDVASDTNTLVVAGDGGRIARSTDFGLTWTEIPSPLTSNAGMPRFADDDHGWVFAGKTLAHTADGGLSWQVQPTSNTGDISDLIAVDANHAFFLASGLYRTGDGGETWVALSNASNGAVSDLTVTPGGRLYGSGGTISSSDGGLTWNGYGIESSRVDTVGEDHVWALGNRYYDLSYISRSSDAGKTWITSTLDTAFRAMDFVDADHGWAVSHSAVYKSEDGGATWGPASLGAGCQCDDLWFSDVVFLDAQRGWILADEPNSQIYGYDLIVITTNDGGGTWVRQQPIQIWLSFGFDARLKFVSATEGWLVGGIAHDYLSTPLLRHTCDGGQTWECRASGTPAHGNLSPVVSRHSGNGLREQYGDSLNDVDFAGLNGWAVGDNGLIERTTDGGATWADFRYPPGTDLLSVQTMGPDTVFVGGAGGLVLRWDAPPARLYLPLLVQ